MSWDAAIDLARATTAYVGSVLTQTFITPSATFAATSLLAAFLLASAFLLARRSPRRRRVRLGVLIRALVPKRWFDTPTARADIGLAAFNLFLFGAMFSWAVMSGQIVSSGISRSLVALFGTIEPLPISNAAAIAIMTVALFLAYELAYWLDHYLSHRIPFLWQFHKVHHSAETLSPLTNARVHPVDTIVYYNITALVMGIVGGLAYWGLGRSVPAYTLWSTNAIAFVFGYTTAHLHHTHMWIAFTGWWGRLLISPAHHQIHHSTNPIHFDKNLGGSLAIFDWMFGTLHIPSRTRERLTFGLERQAVCPHSLVGVTIAPFRDALALVTPNAAERGAETARSEMTPQAQPAAR